MHIGLTFLRIRIGKHFSGVQERCSLLKTVFLFCKRAQPFTKNQTFSLTLLQNVLIFGRLVVLESGLGLESGLKSIFAGLGLGHGLGGSASKSFFQVLFVPTIPIAL